MLKLTVDHVTVRSVKQAYNLIGTAKEALEPKAPLVFLLVSQNVVASDPDIALRSDFPHAGMARISVLVALGRTWLFQP